jgi:hypothetical protein
LPFKKRIEKTALSIAQVLSKFSILILQSTSARVHFKKTWACWQANLGYFAIRRLYKWCLLPYEMGYF